MFKTHRQGNLTVLHYRFSSLEEYLNHLEHAQVAPSFRDCEVSKQDFDAFTGSASLEEAIRMCRFGFHEGFDRFFALNTAIMHELDMSFDVVRTFDDYVGFAPDVKAFLEGSPLTMINRPDPVRKSIRIFMNTSYDSSVEEEPILHRGATVLTTVMILEMLHYAVDLHLFEMSYCDMGDGGVEVHFSEFLLKAPGERVNAQKLFFPLCHPSWIRRLNFRLIETTPHISYQWAGTYGIPCGDRMMRKILDLHDGDILIPTMEELVMDGNDIVRDARLMFERFNTVLPAEDRLKLREIPATPAPLPVGRDF